MVLRSIRNTHGRITDFECLFSNRDACLLVGHSPTELRRRPLLELLPSWLEQDVGRDSIAVVETGERCDRQIQCPRGGGDGLLDMHVTKVGDGVSVLVTQPRTHTDRVGLRLGLVDELLDQAPFAISIVEGPEHRFVLANPEYERMLGRQNIVGRTMREVFPELPSNAPVIAMLDEVRATGTRFTSREFEVLFNREGAVESRYFEFTCAPVSSSTATSRSEVTAIQTVAVDVTAHIRSRQRAEALAEALELNERQFQATFETVAVGIAHLSPRGRWLRFNDRVAQMLGYSRQELQELRVHDITHPDDLARDVELADSLLRGDIPSYQLEKRYRKRDGEFIWVNLAASLVRDADRRALFFVAVIENIGERKAAEDAVRIADRQKDEFLAMLSHELRNPLAAIRSACALLETTDSTDPLMSRVQTVLARQTGHMAHLLDELLDLARVTNGKLTLVPSVVDLRDIVREVLSDLEIPERGPTLTVELPQTGVWVEGDRVRLVQVIDNLVSNAIKYTPEHGSIWLALELDNDNDRATLTVTDTGVGFDRDFADQLFEPFQQAPQNIARSAGGLGLGLALAKSIVELHGGSIRARSEGRGLGSAFEVQLPLTDLPHQAPPPPRTDSVAPTPVRVMIVEDNEDAAELLAALLRARNFEVELASRGEQAMVMIRAWRPNAVICDIGLPDIDGYAVARMIREDPALARTRLVALSGYGQAKDRARAAEAGFDQHLTKPAPIEAVVRAITP